MFANTRLTAHFQVMENGDCCEIGWPGVTCFRGVPAARSVEFGYGERLPPVDGDQPFLLPPDIGRHADCVTTVEGNMPTLYRQLRKLPWASIPAVSSVTTGHGRRGPLQHHGRAGRPGSSSPAPPRSRRSAALHQEGEEDRRGRSTSSPAIPVPTRSPRSPWPRGSAATGRSRTSSTGQNGKRAPRDGNATWPSVSSLGRVFQHRRRQPSSRRRPAAHSHAAPERINDFAGSLGDHRHSALGEIGVCHRQAPA